MLNMKVTRSMNGRAVHDKILQGFKVSKYTILECDSSGHEVMCLYLCEEFQVCTSCRITSSQQSLHIHTLLHYNLKSPDVYVGIVGWIYRTKIDPISIRL